MNGDIHIPQVQLRQKRNLILFIISYVINNLASGILYDTYVNYLQEVSLPTATSFWAFYGYATFLSALILLLVPKSGYKKLLLFCAASTSAAFFCVVFVKSATIFYLSTLLALTGVQLHFIMLAPYVAAYAGSAGGKSIDWYTRTYYMGYVGYFLTTFLGGAATVKLFSSHAGISFERARKLTEYITETTGSTRDAYLAGNRDVLIITGVVTLLSIVPILFIREEKSDYISVEEQQTKKQSLPERARDILSVLFRKDAMMYLIYWALISFAMGLFTSYYTVFLNRNLHIDKATSSLLVSDFLCGNCVVYAVYTICCKKNGNGGNHLFYGTFIDTVYADHCKRQSFRKSHDPNGRNWSVYESRSCQSWKSCRQRTFDDACTEKSAPGFHFGCELYCRDCQYHQRSFYRKHPFYDTGRISDSLLYCRRFIFCCSACNHYFV